MRIPMLGTAVFDTPGFRVPYAPMRPRRRAPEPAADISDASARRKAGALASIPRRLSPTPIGPAWSALSSASSRTSSPAGPMHRKSLLHPARRAGRADRPRQATAHDHGNRKPGAQPMPELICPNASKPAAMPSGPSTGCAGLLSCLRRPARSPNPYDRPRRHLRAIRAGEAA